MEETDSEVPFPMTKIMQFKVKANVSSYLVSLLIQLSF